MDTGSDNPSGPRFSSWFRCLELSSCESKENPLNLHSEQCVLSRGLSEPTVFGNSIKISGGTVTIKIYVFIRGYFRIRSLPFIYIYIYIIDK